MARVTVGPKSGGRWQVTGETRTFNAQADAPQIAPRQLLSSGGGELIVEVRDGRVRMQNPIARPDPRRTKG